MGGVAPPPDFPDGGESQHQRWDLRRPDGAAEDGSPDADRGVEQNWEVAAEPGVGGGGLVG